MSASAAGSDEATDAMLRALADPQRRRILRLVGSQELAAGQIATNFEVTQQAVSHHLQVLQRRAYSMSAAMGLVGSTCSTPRR